MTSFFKENFVLILGGALPLLLAVGFLIATKISVIGIDPPKTAILYYYQTYSPGSDTLKVKDGQVYYRPIKQKYDGEFLTPSLYLFNPASGDQRKINLPSGKEVVINKDVLISDLKDIRLNTEKESPDGFSFANNLGGYRGGIVTEIFGGSRYNRNDNFLVKGALKVPVPKPDPYEYGQAQFLGWVVSE